MVYFQYITPLPTMLYNVHYIYPVTHTITRRRQGQPMQGTIPEALPRLVLLFALERLCCVVSRPTWRQAGSLPLLAVVGSVLQRRTLCHQWPAGAAELQRLVVGRWVKGQRVESWRNRDKYNTERHFKMMLRQLWS